MSYVKIQSTKTINVTPGLQHKDSTIEDLHVVDRLKIAPVWPRATVLIREGIGYYPSEITTWPTVKALSKKNILTIGETVDEPASPEISTTTFDEMKNALKEAEPTSTSGKRSRKHVSLDDDLASLAE